MSTLPLSTRASGYTPGADTGLSGRLSEQGYVCQSLTEKGAALHTRQDLGWWRGGLWGGLGGRLHLDLRLDKFGGIM